ncbi:MAG: class I SAM-dependent methyltransferase [Myxococcota bacterium]
MALHPLLNHVAFRAGAAAYDAMTGQDLWREQIAQVLVHARPARPRRVLDLGCGPGVSAFVLARRLGPDTEVVGIDLSPTMIERARAHHRREHADLRNLSFQVGDATSLPFDDDAFELAVGHSFLYLVPDRPGVLAEARRVLAPASSIVLLEPNREGSLVRAGMSTIDQRPQSRHSTTDLLRFASSMVGWRLFSKAAGRLSPQIVAPLMLEAGFVDPEFHPTLRGLGLHCVGRVPRT